MTLIKKLSTSLALFRRNFSAAPFEKAFNMVKAGKHKDCKPMEF